MTLRFRDAQGKERKLPVKVPVAASAPSNTEARAASQPVLGVSCQDDTPGASAMSENTQFGFAKLVPGFDFLQNLAKGASQSLPQLPNLSNWIAPTLNVEELDRRIGELKAVHFWLDQNSKALGATIQALEGEDDPGHAAGHELQHGRSRQCAEAQDPGKAGTGRAEGRPKPPRPRPALPRPSARRKPRRSRRRKRRRPAPRAAAARRPVDPLQWWGALTQQFQEIAANAMKDVAQKAAVDSAKTMAAGAKEAVKPAGKSSGRKTPARKRTAAT